MSTTDQCPSSKKAGRPADTGAASLQTAAGTGRTYWRSLDELADTQDFKDFLQREFPAAASELLNGSRRTFLKIMGASVALAGAATLPGCRRPEHKIITYHEKPEDIVPGKPLFYATTVATPGGGAEGLLVETLSGRPTKIEGNPLHPYNNGVTTIDAQASVLSLYDPDRTPGIVNAMSKQRAARDEGTEFAVEPWSDFSGAFRANLDALPGDGTGLVFLVSKKSSPTRDRLRDRVAQRMPAATWLAYDPVDNDAELEGTTIAFGAPHHVEHRLNNADVVVSLAHDFMGRDATLTSVRGWGRNRIREGEGARAARDTQMSRLYVAEPLMTLTGGQADHRMGLRVRDVAAVAIAIAERVMQNTGGGANLARAVAQARTQLPTADIRHAESFAKHATEDLIVNTGRSVLMVGPAMPAAIHALAAAVNDALNNTNATVAYRAPKGDSGVRSHRSLATLASMIDAGSVRTLVAIDTNPAFDAPGDLGLAEKLESVPAVFHLGESNETAEMATHHAGIAHPLEAWGDAENLDGTFGITQPMIKPLHGFKSEIELLAFALGDDEADGHTEVTRTLAARIGLSSPDADTARFKREWRRTLHDGLRTDSVNSTPAVRARANATAIGAAVVDAAARLADAPESIDLVFVTDDNLAGGRNANNGWLQELPDTVTKCCWGNPAMISLDTAEALGLRTSRKLGHPQYNHTEVIKVTVDGRSVELPIWIQPGMPNNTVVLRCGNGRRVGGRIADGTGDNVFPVRSSASPAFTPGAAVERSADRGPELVANTQDHWSMEGRDIVREADLPAWQKFGDDIYYEWQKNDDGKWVKDFKNSTDAKVASILKTAYADKRELTFAGRFGMEAHSPELQTSYTDAQDHFYVELKRDENGKVLKDKNKDPLIKRDDQGRPVGKLNPHGVRVQQWGMTIDMNTCTGCGACAVACQAENNIPIVGKKEVAKGREMSWIRVDRYYGTARGGKNIGAGDPHATMMTMPVACLHCENAPCEVVCPVNATVHGEEGTNNMAYNRCIGTRYCANNCPYKVRRFNLFDYAVKQFEGGFGQVAEGLADTPAEALIPQNENFIPPRLREKRVEVSNMQYNPHVTVRSRGVMEKCTFCIQRVNESRVETKVHDLPFIPDGFFQTACQQVCPTNAIVFGDMYDYESHDGKGSEVYRSMKTQRAYGLLSYLNTRPRLLHLLRIRNPNAALLRETGEGKRISSWDHPFHDSGEHHGDEQHDAVTMRLPVLNAAPDAERAHA